MGSTKESTNSYNIIGKNVLNKRIVYSAFHSTHSQNGACRVADLWENNNMVRTEDTGCRDGGDGGENPVCGENPKRIGKVNYCDVISTIAVKDERIENEGNLSCRR